MLAAISLSFAVGFLSLSIEILWIRLFGFANHSLPQAFAFVLVFFLLGIAFGAQLGKRFCVKSNDLWKITGFTLICSALVDLIGPWVYASFVQTQAQLYVGAILITFTAFLKAVIFPIAHHLGVSKSAIKVGKRISRVYVANIIGATLGPMFSGVVLLSLFSTQQCFIICAGLTLLTAIYCLSTRLNFLVFSTASAVTAMMVTGIFIFHANDLIARVAYPFGDIRRIIENQYGIITIYYGGKGGDIVAGGNVYDGRTNVDPIINSNGIHRVIVLSALQERPKKILMLGLSIGSWLKILTSFPGVQSIDVVEINPGYLKAIADYMPQTSGLLDPRVHVYIDDGRRWLKTHPEQKYDLIVMNTTYYWRAYSASLLSREFLQLLKQHMNEGAVLSYNTTESPDVLKTAVSVFKNAYLYSNFAVAADFDWRKKLQDPHAYEILASLNLDGKSLFPPNSENVIAIYLNQRIVALETLQKIYAQLGRRIEVVTDRNLITEYKYGKSL